MVRALLDSGYAANDLDPIYWVTWAYSPSLSLSLPANPFKG